MPPTNEEIRKDAEELAARFPDMAAAAKESRAQVDADINVHKKKAVDQILSELTGIGPDDKDSTYTQHPLMAGVLRRAAEMAYERALHDFTMNLMKSILAAPVPAPAPVPL